MPVNDETTYGAETSPAYEPCLEAAYAFLDAFVNCDWERFRNYFAEDAAEFGRGPRINHPPVRSRLSYP